MSIPRFSVNQSLFINLVSFIIIVIGIMVLFGMNREIWPNVAFDVVTVTATYSGATPTDVEKLITIPIEKEIREVDHIKEMNSSSTAGISVVSVQIDPDEKDKQKVIRDVQNAVEKVKNLPQDVEKPVVSEVSVRQYPIIEVSLSGEIDEHTLQKHADTLEDILEDVKGVARIRKAGYREREIHVLVDPAKMEQYYVSFDEMEQALAGRNISLPAGELSTDQAEYNIRTTGEFLTAEEVGDVIIRSSDVGNALRVRDVAVVKDSFKDEEIINKTLKTRSINLTVVKKESGDAISIVDKIKEKSDAYLSLQDGDALQISYVNDYSFFARRRLNVLRNNAWFGMAIVLLLLFTFLHWRVALVTFIGVPVAFFTTFVVMDMMGITINLVSMFGLIIVLGMLVDDGIIVAENVYRYIEKGVPPREAAVKGTEEVMGAVTTAVMTTIAAFAPLLFMTGIIGKFIRNIPIVLIIALAASLVEALMILPSHLSDFVKIRRASGTPVTVAKELPWFKALIYYYTKTVRWAIRHKWLVFITAVLIAFFSVALIGLGFTGKGPVKFVLFPNVGIDFFFIRAEAPIGTSLEKTHELIRPVEEIVSNLPEEELDTFVTTVGRIEEDRHDPFAGQESHLTQITVYLVPERDRERGVEEIVDELREKVKDVRGFEDLRFDLAEAGPPVGKPVEARIRGEHFDTLDTIAKQFMDFLRTINGTSDITWDHKPGKKELRVNVNREAAAKSGLSIRQIAKTVRAVFEGSIATHIRPEKAEEETDVTIRFDRDTIRDISTFKKISIRNAYGKLVPLQKVASIEEVPGTTTIHHLDGKRVVTVSSNLDADTITPLAANTMLTREFGDIGNRYPGYSVKYGGEQEESLESLRSLLKAFFFAFLIIYLMLASFFKSLIHPFVVMLAIPFGLIGVLFAFIVHNLPLSFMAVFGIVGLNGIVVNDSIVLVDFINKLRKSGMDKRHCIIKAGQMRIRPVILTTVTTFGGLSTVAYGIGGKDPFLVPMALAICWGLLFATVLTLIIIPCIYSIIDDIAEKLTHHSSIIETPCKE